MYIRHGRGRGSAAGADDHTCIRAEELWPGASDTEVKIGSTAPFSGPVAAASTPTKSFAAAGNDLTRESILKQATKLHDVALPMLLPGIAINTSPPDYRAIKQLQFEYFDGENWVPSGGIVSA